MGLISFSTITDGTTATATQVNAPFNTIYNEFNGNISAANLAASAVTDTKIAANNLLATKFSNPYKFSIYKVANQTVTSNTWTKVNLDTAVFDTGSNFDLVTNHQFTAPIAGYYQFNGSITGGSLGGGSFCAVGININTFSSVPTYQGTWQDTGAGTTSPICSMSKLIKLAANDTVQLYVYISGTTVLGASGLLYMDGFLVSSI